MRLEKQRQQAWAQFITAYDRIVRRINGDMDKAGVLSFEWYDVLLALEDAPEQKLRMSDLLETVIISRSGLTRMIDRMENVGLLRREPSAEDRRVTYVALTEKGQAERERTWPYYSDLISQHFAAHLTDEETQAILSVTAKLLSDVQTRADCAPSKSDTTVS